MSTANQLNLIYEDIIFEHNLNILCEEINYLTSIITEENFLDTIKAIGEKIGNFFEASFSAFTKGWETVLDFCKKAFQLTHIKDLMNKLGLTDEVLLQFTQIAKASMLVIPAVKIGYGVVERTYKDIQGNDVAILIDREAYNKKTEELFGEQDFLEKCWTIFKSGAKNLIIELFASIPLILKCVTGYALASGFEEAVKDPQFLTDAQKKTLNAMDETNNELGGKKFERDENGKIIPNSNFYTQEQTMARINKNMSQANGGPGTLNMFARSELMKGWVARQEDGSLANVYGTHYNKTNHGAADLMNGTRTRFQSNADGTDGKYVTEKLSETEFLHELNQQYGVPVGGMMGF